MKDTWIEIRRGCIHLTWVQVFFCPSVLKLTVLFYLTIKESRPHVKLIHKIKTPIDFLSQLSWRSVVREISLAESELK